MMSPLKIKILLEYYCNPTFDYGFNNKAEFSSLDELIADGMIESRKISPDSERRFQLTYKGKFWLETILNLPLPEVRYYIPDRNDDPIYGPSRN